MIKPLWSCVAACILWAGASATSALDTYCHIFPIDGPFDPDEYEWYTELNAHLSNCLTPEPFSHVAVCPDWPDVCDENDCHDIARFGQCRCEYVQEWRCCWVPGRRGRGSWQWQQVCVPRWYQAAAALPKSGEDGHVRSHAKVGATYAAYDALKGKPDAVLPAKYKDKLTGEGSRFVFKMKADGTDREMLGQILGVDLGTGKLKWFLIAYELSEKAPGGVLTPTWKSQQPVGALGASTAGSHTTSYRVTLDFGREEGGTGAALGEQTVLALLYN